jgi:hypothetical protein
VGRGKGCNTGCGGAPWAGTLGGACPPLGVCRGMDTPRTREEVDGGLHVLRWPPEQPQPALVVAAAMADTVGCLHLLLLLLLPHGGLPHGHC